MDILWRAELVKLRGEKRIAVYFPNKTDLYTHVSTKSLQNIKSLFDDLDI